MHRSLVGGRIQRVSLAPVGGCDIALLKIRLPPRGPDDLAAEAPAETVYVVLAGTAGVGTRVGVCDVQGRARLREAMGNASAPAQAQWRARLEGGRVAALTDRSIGVVVDGVPWCARATDRGGGLALLEGSAASDPAGAAPPETLAMAGTRLVERLVGAAAGARRTALARAIDMAIARIGRRLEAVEGDLARMASAADGARRARLFVAAAAQAPRGAIRLEAIDWESGDPRPVAMTVDPARSAAEQVEAMFKRARRLKDGAHVARTRLADGGKIREELMAVSAALRAGDDAILGDIEARARAAAPRDFRLGSSRPGPAPRGTRLQAPLPPYRTFTGESGARILVGRGAEHNDALTFRVARPHDLWLHARSRAGAHVIVPLEKGASCPADALVEAAHLAAHFSEAREERVVEVTYTPRRYLRKPRGSAPGLVVVDREKVIVLRREDDRLGRLLDREAASAAGQESQGPGRRG